jgi:hypothetical protein
MLLYTGLHITPWLFVGEDWDHANPINALCRYFASSTLLHEELTK